MDDQERQDVKRIRALFWAKFKGLITLVEMQAEVKKIMDRQLSFVEVSR